MRVVDPLAKLVAKYPKSVRVVVKQFPLGFHKQAQKAAEARMAEVRQELEDAGHHIRVINQAYFAWYGTYAARPDATDPIGGYLREVRERTGSLSAFVETIRGWTSRADVEAGLVDLGGMLAGE